MGHHQLLKWRLFKKFLSSWKCSFNLRTMLTANMLFRLFDLVLLLKESNMLDGDKFEGIFSFVTNWTNSWWDNWQDTADKYSWEIQLTNIIVEKMFTNTSEIFSWKIQLTNLICEILLRIGMRDTVERYSSKIRLRITVWWDSQLWYKLEKKNWWDNWQITTEKYSWQINILKYCLEIRIRNTVEI